jgi:hypothetical protein
MKKTIFTVLSLTLGLGAVAQDRPPTRAYTYTDDIARPGFRKENLFIGGSLNLGITEFSFNAGASPEIGFSLNKWLDAGAVVNFNYNSIRADPTYDQNIRYHNFTYGGGVFARAYPLPFLFLTAQPEVNWLSLNAKNMTTGFSSTQNTHATSLLVGIGYGQRVIGQGSFFMSLMFDVLGNVNSPYNDINGHPVPLIRAGFDIYLHGR